MDMRNRASVHAFDDNWHSMLMLGRVPMKQLEIKPLITQSSTIIRTYADIKTGNICGVSLICPYIASQTTSDQRRWSRRLKETGI